MTIQNQPERSTGGPPIHYLAAIITVIMDWVWGVGEGAATASIVGIWAVLPLMLATGFTAFMGVSLVQRYIAHDTWGASLAKGLVMGVVAGVPYPVTGTAIGGVLVGWAGLNGLGVLRPPKPQQQLPPSKPPTT